MREVVALLFAIALVVAAWKQPLRDQVRSLLPSLKIAPSRISQLAEKASTRASQQRAAEHADGAGNARRESPQPPPDNSWMWGPTSLDRKKK